MNNDRSNNWVSRKINHYKKEIRIRKNYSLSFYLLGCTSLFFFSDIIQKSSLTSNYEQKNIKVVLKH